MNFQNKSSSQNTYTIHRNNHHIMFSSSSNLCTTTSSHVSPFQPHFPISSSNYNHHHHAPPFPPPLCEAGDIFPHHFHDHLFSTQFPPHPQTLFQLGVSSNAVPPSINAPLSSGDDHHQYYHHSFCSNTNSNNINLPYFHHSSKLGGRKEDLAVRVVKKDRHSKIFTSQGLRDRRVRLSINVARQFFDLQDLLGFDKASKTLEWLLTKSRKAIKQLGGPRTRHSKSLSSSSSGSECEDDEEEVEDHARRKEKETKKLKEAESEAVHVLVAKETRAKARARARARTKEKSMFTSTSSSRRPGILNDCDEATSICPSKVDNQELGSLLADQAHPNRPDVDRSVDPVNKVNTLRQYSSMYSNYNVISGESASHHNWDTNGVFPCPSPNGI